MEPDSPQSSSGSPRPFPQALQAGPGGPDILGIRPVGGVIQVLPASARAISSRWAWLLEGRRHRPGQQPRLDHHCHMFRSLSRCAAKNGGHIDEIDVSPASASRSDHAKRAAVPLWDRHIHSISLYFPSTK